MDNLPICKICGSQSDKMEDFDSFTWRQFYLKEDHPETLWICPDCLEAIGYNKVFDELIKLQNACGEIMNAAKESLHCGH